MRPPRFTCPVPEHHGACALESFATDQPRLRIESVDSAVVVRGPVTDGLLTAVRGGHPTRHVTLDDDTLVIWPATWPSGGERGETRGDQRW